MRKMSLIVAGMVMMIALAGCGSKEKMVSEEPSKITQAQDIAEDTSKEVDAIENDVVSEPKQEQSPAVNDKQDDDNEEDFGIKVEYTTTNLKDIFDEGSVCYSDCVDRVIDDIQFKIPADSAHFFIRADYTVLYDEEEFSKYEQIFNANKYDVYMRRLNSTTYYIVFNTETGVGVSFAHVIRNYDENTFDSVLKTFNIALEDYLTGK